MLRALRNLLLFEILAATVFVGIVASVLLNRLAFYQEAAEKANMEFTISSMRSALRIRMATMMTQGQAGQYGSLAQDNPMDWLELKPANYTGITTALRPSEPPPGTWVYDSSSKTLIYRVKHGEYFQSDTMGQQQVRLKIVLSTEQYPMGNDQNPLVTGVRLVLIEPYKWF